MSYDEKIVLFIDHNDWLLIVSNLGNMVFGISKEFSWTTTLWESLFFFIFVFLLQNYRKK